MSAALDVSGLVAGYDRTVVVRDLSLSVEAGRTAVVIGPNGHGKTTMLLAISGLIKPMRALSRWATSASTAGRPSRSRARASSTSCRATACSPT